MAHQKTTSLRSRGNSRGHAGFLPRHKELVTIIGRFVVGEVTGSGTRAGYAMTLTLHTPSLPGDLTQDLSGCGPERPFPVPANHSCAAQGGDVDQKPHWTHPR